ncbi:hypothetical protein OS493_004421 [Desmophyllum pertusum]|uniref:Transmembrane protein n=1 Tax=Desmophyllum pertusum TaxID=174260 RepID=A0A9W9ZUI9_9CNID|nr:hypothetical protein OS493_004421 [Desmophyllum pertusum]
MTDLVEVGKAKAAGIVSILIGITAFGDLICGFIYAMKGGPDGSGIWTGLGMVFFLVLDILWVVVCVAGVIVTLLIWFVYHVIRKVIEANCHLTDAGTCHCSGKADVPIKINNCDDVRIIERCLLAIVLLNGVGAVLVLAGSIIGCMGTCCASQTHTNVIVVEQSGMAMQPTHNATGVPPPPDYSMTVGKR